MFDWFELQSLRAKLALGFGAVIGLMLLVAGTAMLGHGLSLATIDGYLDNEDHISDLSVDARAELEVARRYEKMFLLELHGQDVGQVPSQYALLVSEQLAKVRQNMAAIRSLVGGHELAPQTYEVASASTRYESGFLRAAALYERLGAIDLALERQLAAIDTALARVPITALRRDLAALHCHARNLLSCGVPAYGAQVDAAVHRFQRDLFAGQSAPADKRSLLLAVFDYQQHVRRLVAMTAQVEAATRDYLPVASQIESRLAQLQAHADTVLVSARGKIRRLDQMMTAVIVGGAAVAILLGLMVASFIVRNAQRSVQAGVEFSARLAKGDWSACLPIPPGRHEFSRLAAALNSMAESMRAAYHSEQTRNAELLRLNRTLRMLSDCNEALMHAPDEAGLLNVICAQITRSGGYARAWVGLAHNIGQVASAGLPGGEVVADFTHGAGSCVALSLRVKNELLGTLNICSAASDSFDTEELALLQELANDLAFGIVSLREVARREAAESALDYQSSHDPLTQLANRSLFIDRLRAAIALAVRAGRQVAVIGLSLDRFRMVEDNLGHEAGNRLLLHVTNALTAVLRDGDTVARLAGAEFAIAVNDVNSENDLMPIALKLQAAICRPLSPGGGAVYSSVSMGISLSSKAGAGTEAEALLRSARAALSAAHAQGGDCIHFYAPEMNARLSALFAMESELRHALAHGELEVHYQAKANLSSGALTGAEALVRWRHPRRGMVSPGDFIPIAESTGLILPLGSWVVREVCRQQRSWLDAGMKIYPVSVNLSPRQLRQDDLVQQIQHALQSNHLDAAYLDMEITESSLMDNLDAGIATLRALKATGMKLYLDDFGTGHSSLSRLRKLPIDYLKIDQSFVRNLSTDAADVAICRAIINLASNLDMQVVAEGVETKHQADFLRQSGCDEMQGYYFSRPIGAADFAALLVKHADSGSSVLVDDELAIARHRAIRCTTDSH